MGLAPAVPAERKRIILAVTGATGAIYFLRTLRALLLNGHTVDLVISKFGLMTLKDETDGFREDDRPFVEWFFSEHGEEVKRGALTLYNYQDQTAPIASGSGTADGMAVVPCTMKTLAGIAHGFSSNLIERAADVMLKERRPLVLVPREAPYNLVHLKNMVAATEAGAIIVPASPAFYQRPRTFDDLGDFLAARILKLFGIDLDLYPKWQGLEKSKRS